MPLNMRFRFSPTKDGLVKVLGPLETEIMQIIWQDERSTVKKVHRKLSQQRDIVYTTAITEDDFVTMVVQQVLDGLLDDYSETAIDYMVDYLARRNPSELRRLQKALQARVAA